MYTGAGNYVIADQSNPTVDCVVVPFLPKAGVLNKKNNTFKPEASAESTAETAEASATSASGITDAPKEVLLPSI